MERRGFLKLFATASAAAGLGIAPIAVASSSGGLYSIRYIEAYDVMKAQLVHRIDISRGFALEMPVAIEHGIAYRSVSASQIVNVIDQMRKQAAAIPDRKIIARILSDMPTDYQIVGFTWS